MIKITEKNLTPTQIPVSLRLPITGYNNRKSLTTHKRREEVIAAQKYIDDDNHNNRYKQDDVKNDLEIRYHAKCGYCEQRIESYHVEHYRPKAIYYWLAYSWDNLLLCCPTCNVYKSNNFNTINPRVSYSPSDLPNIHQLFHAYQIAEQPLLLHPEYDDAEPLLTFNARGEISSSDPRAKYTIDKCKLDRKPLTDWRREVLDDFIKKLNDKIYFSSSKTILESQITSVIRDFVSEAYDDRKEYLAFRRYVLKHIIPTILPLT